jgi:hypothetical protein
VDAGSWRQRLQIHQLSNQVIQPHDAFSLHRDHLPEMLPYRHYSTFTHKPQSAATASDNLVRPVTFGASVASNNRQTVYSIMQIVADYRQENRLPLPKSAHQ